MAEMIHVALLLLGLNFLVVCTTFPLDKHYLIQNYLDKKCSFPDYDFALFHIGKINMTFCRNETDPLCIALASTQDATCELRHDAKLTKEMYDNYTVDKFCTESTSWVDDLKISHSDVWRKPENCKSLCLSPGREDGCKIVFLFTRVFNKTGKTSSDNQLNNKGDDVQLQTSQKQQNTENKQQNVSDLASPTGQQQQTAQGGVPPQTVNHPQTQGVVPIPTSQQQPYQDGVQQPQTGQHPQTQGVVPIPTGQQQQNQDSVRQPQTGQQPLTQAVVPIPTGQQQQNQDDVQQPQTGQHPQTQGVVPIPTAQQQQNQDSVQQSQTGQQPLTQGVVPIPTGQQQQNQDDVQQPQTGQQPQTQGGVPIQPGQQQQNQDGVQQPQSQGVVLIPTGQQQQNQDSVQQPQTGQQPLTQGVVPIPTGQQQQNQDDVQQPQTGQQPLTQGVVPIPTGQQQQNQDDVQQPQTGQQPQTQGVVPISTGQQQQNQDGVQQPQTGQQPQTQDIGPIPAGQQQQNQDSVQQPQTGQQPQSQGDGFTTLNTGQTSTTEDHEQSPDSQKDTNGVKSSDDGQYHKSQVNHGDQQSRGGYHASQNGNFVVRQEDLDEEDEPSSGHFMAYFLTAVVLCVAGYVIFHNKQKIVAFVVEGRSGKRQRRPKSGDYRKLQANVEEVMPSLEKSTTENKFIY